VTGTNGKGTNQHVDQRSFRRDGPSGGDFTSPGPARRQEAHRHNAEPIDDESFVGLLSRSPRRNGISGLALYPF